VSNPSVTPTSEHSYIQCHQAQLEADGLPLSPSRNSSERKMIPTANRSPTHKRTRKAAGRARRRRLACELPAEELQQQRKLAREAANRRRSRWLEEQAELDNAMAAVDQHTSELNKEYLQLQQELTILKDVVYHRL
jgi:hypothetical protein